MTPREALIAEVTSPWRARSRDGEIQGHRAFYDLDPEGRLASFDEALQLRRLESAADPDGLSATARAVLSRLR